MVIMFISLRDLFEETVVDVARYFFLMRRGDAQMVFDLDLALDQSEKNPVYKGQYAHARMASIFRRADVDAAEIELVGVDLSHLTTEDELGIIKEQRRLAEIGERAAEA